VLKDAAYRLRKTQRDRPAELLPPPLPTSPTAAIA
jgi:hypothetical protein